MEENENFGTAIQYLKSGRKVARRGWNGNGMYLVIMDGYPNGVPANIETQQKHNLDAGELVYLRPYFALFTAQKDIAMWSPSGADALAEDWYIV